jgi:hypothetical protein
MRARSLRAGLNDIATLYELASTLARRACGMPLDPAAATCSQPPSGCPDAQAALKKFYGQPLPGEDSAEQLRSLSLRQHLPQAKPICA